MGQVCSVIVLTMFIAGCTAGAGWERLHQEALTLSKQDKYDGAVVVEKQALEAAEKTFGPEHPQVAHVLNRLAGFYYT